MKLGDLGEFGLINRLAGLLPGSSGAVIKGIGDDTAVLAAGGDKLVLMTTDMLTEDVHFSRRYCPLAAIGWKALAVNISDIAAMGGLPGSAVVSIGIPPAMEVSQLEDLYRGLSRCAGQYGVDIVGGDTVKSPQGLVINVALLGWVEPDRVIYRSGAQAGDIIMVTGSLGWSAAGLYALQNDIDSGGVDRAVKAHLYPEVRVQEGRLLSCSGVVTAMNDISDGLASEVLEICQASGTGCTLDKTGVPCLDGAEVLGGRAGVTPLEWALYGGEDFELVFTVKPEGADVIKTVLTAAGCKVSAVGVIKPPQQGCCIETGTGRIPLKPGGYDHFRD